MVHGFHRSRPDWGGDVLDRPCQLEDLAGGANENENPITPLRYELRNWARWLPTRACLPAFAWFDPRLLFRVNVLTAVGGPWASWVRDAGGLIRVCVGGP